MTRRGISEVITSMFMLAIVVGVGSVILFSGYSNIMDFTTMVSFFVSDIEETHLENLTLEHIRYYPLGNNVTLWLRNTGDSQVTIDSIAIVKIDTQDLILDDDDMSQVIFIGDIISVEKATPLTQGTGQFNDDYYKNSKYRITITTSKGNVFETIAKPFNT